MWVSIAGSTVVTVLGYHATNETKRGSRTNQTRQVDFVPGRELSTVSASSKYPAGSGRDSKALSAEVEKAKESKGEIYLSDLVLPL